MTLLISSCQCCLVSAGLQSYTRSVPVALDEDTDKHCPLLIDCR